MGRLPQQAEQFARELAAGKSRRAAYRAAYPAYRDRPDKTVDSRAAALLAHGYGGRVKQLYERLTGLPGGEAYSRAQAVQDLLWARDRARGEASDPASANLTAYLRAVEQLINLSGLKREEMRDEAVTIFDDLPAGRQEAEGQSLTSQGDVPPQPQSDLQTAKSVADGQSETDAGGRGAAWI